MATVFEAPDTSYLDMDDTIFRIFLGGTIDMGLSDDWQKSLIERIQDLDALILNPRRKDWNSSWEQKIDNPQFSEQVNWELDAIEQSDLRVFVFLAGSQSPITLMELGLIANESGFQTVVYCPEGFWRKGNVDIVCERNGIEVVENFDDLEEVIRERYTKMNARLHA